MPNIVDVRAKIVEIKKMVTKIYEWPVVVELVVETVIPTIEVPNILADPVAIQVEETREYKKIKKRKAKASNKKARLKSILDEQDRKT